MYPQIKRSSLWFYIYFFQFIILSTYVLTTFMTSRSTWFTHKALWQSCAVCIPHSFWRFTGLKPLSNGSNLLVKHYPTLSNMFDCAVQMGQTCWSNMLVKHVGQTLSKTIQHVWLCCSNGSNMLGPTIFDDVWPICLIRLNRPLQILQFPRYFFSFF